MTIRHRHPCTLRYCSANHTTESILSQAGQAVARHARDIKQMVSDGLDVPIAKVETPCFGELQGCGLKASHCAGPAISLCLGCCSQNDRQRSQEVPPTEADSNVC